MKESIEGMVRDVCVSRIVKMDETTRQVTHVISTAKLDRGNRIIDQAGWSLTEYRKNPVVLANHDYSIESIIGRATDIKVVGGELVSTTEFDTEGIGALAFRLVQSGLAKAWSVGWRGNKSHRIGELADCPICQDAMKQVEYGTHFTRQSLLEYSLVAIPANPEAVMGLQAAGFEFSDNDLEELSKFSVASDALPPTEEAPNGAKVADVVPVTRSAAFYDALFDVSRRLGRRNSAHEAARRFGRKES